MTFKLVKTVLLAATLGLAQAIIPMAQPAGSSTSSLLCSELKDTIVSIFAQKAAMPLTESAQAPVIQVVEAAPIVIAAAPVVAQSIWEGVRENSKEIAHNLVNAGANVASYVPYVLRQITHEAKTLTHALQDMPITSTALLVAAVYGCWKAYSWFRQPEVHQRVMRHCREIRENWSASGHQARNNH